MCEKMIQSTDDSRFKRDLQTAAAVGLVSGAIDVGFQMFRQKEIMRSPTEKLKLESQVAEDTFNLAKNKAEKTNFIGKIFNFIDEKNLYFKRNKLERLSENQYAFRSLAKGFGENVILWGVISLGLSALLNAFNKKED